MKRGLLLTLPVAVIALAGAGYAWFDTDSHELPQSLHSGLSAGTSFAPAGVTSSTASASGGYDLSAHQTLSRVIILIKENYVDPDRIQPYEMFLAALDYIEKTVAEVIVDDTQAPRQITVAVGTANHVFDLERLGGLDQLWEVTLALRDIFRFLQVHIDDPEQRRDIEYAAINGMLSTLDPHSVLLKPESFNEVKLSTKGEFGGLGIVISIRDGALTIISPIEDTPASRAGLNAQDQIIKINDESTVNMSLEEAVERLRGKPGSKVTVWVKRKKWTESKRFVLMRAIIKIQSVTSELLADAIGYVKIKSFQANTFDDLHAHLEGLRARNRGPLAGLILDLRNNPGGLLDQAILISDRFVEKGPLVITVGEGNRKREVKSAHGPGTESDYPLAVLVNGGSASASEIVSGAVKNHNRGVIIGEQTFGKGSVQVLYDFKDRSALKLTIAQYLTPGDISIQSRGITPDIEVAHASVEEKDVHLFVHDSSPREKDLDHHLDNPEVVSPGAGVDEALAGDEPIRVVHLEEEVDEDLAAVPEATDEFRSDYEIELAQQILKNARSTDRRKVLEQSRGLLKRNAVEEQRRMAARLKSVGIDWSEGKKGRDGSAAVTLESNLRSGTIKAGEVLSLTATVTNTGPEPLYRVYGVTDSENPLLRNLELVFGKIDPGQARSWTVDVKLPQDMASRADLMTLSVRDMNKSLESVSSNLVVSIQEEAKPRFSFRAVIDDRKGGNGDGVLQFGESVELDITVVNGGPGKAYDASATLKNLSHGLVFLDRGRAKFGEIAAGKEASASMSFSVKRPTRRHNLLGEEIDQRKASLRLSVWDSVLGEPITETLEIPVVDARQLKRDRRAVKVPSGATVKVYSGADDNTSVLARVGAGTVLRSDGSVDGWRRVDLGGDEFGFVRNTEVRVLSGSRKTNDVALNPGVTAPSIALDLEGLVTASSSLRLTGVVKDMDQVQDVFVFLNDKKIYYESFADVGANGGQVKAPLDLALKLKEGSNSVAVVARKNDELVSRRVFGLYRASEGVVAERTVGRDSTTR